LFILSLEAYNMGTMFLLAFLYLLVFLPIFLIFWGLLMKLGLVETPEEMRAWLAKLLNYPRLLSNGHMEFNATSPSFENDIMVPSQTAFSTAYRIEYRFVVRERKARARVIDGSPFSGTSGQLIICSR
jgi:hypothetical protein